MTRHSSEATAADLPSELSPQAAAPNVTLCGNDMAIVDFAPCEAGQTIRPQQLRSANQAARAMMAYLNGVPIDYISDKVAGVCTVAVVFSEDTLRTGQQMQHLPALQTLAQQFVGQSGPSGHLVRLSACFDPALCPDLDEMASKAGLSIRRFIDDFLGCRFQAEVIGFMPGFAYLGGLASHLQFPRRPSPRTVVPEGAVAIAGSQAAVYPSGTPGGWNLIGRCPDLLFEPHRDPPVRIQLGDTVEFHEITRTEFDRLWAQRSK